MQTSRDPVTDLSDEFFIAIFTHICTNRRKSCEARENVGLSLYLPIVCFRQVAMRTNQSSSSVRVLRFDFSSARLLAEFALRRYFEKMRSHICSRFSFFPPEYPWSGLKKSLFAYCTSHILHGVFSRSQNARFFFCTIMIIPQR